MTHSLVQILLSVISTNHIQKLQPVFYNPHLNCPPLCLDRNFQNSVKQINDMMDILVLPRQKQMYIWNNPTIWLVITACCWNFSTHSFDIVLLFIKYSNSFLPLKDKRQFRFEFFFKAECDIKRTILYCHLNAFCEVRWLQANPHVWKIWPFKIKRGGGGVEMSFCCTLPLKCINTCWAKAKWKTHRVGAPSRGHSR